MFLERIGPRAAFVRLLLSFSMFCVMLGGKYPLCCSRICECSKVRATQKIRVWKKLPFLCTQTNGVFPETVKTKLAVLQLNFCFPVRIMCPKIAYMVIVKSQEAAKGISLPEDLHLNLLYDVTCVMFINRTIWEHGYR